MAYSEPAQRRYPAFACACFSRPAQVPGFRLKTCISLFDVHPDSPGSAKQRGRVPVPACGRAWRVNIKRAGFPEGEAPGTLLLVGLNSSSDLQTEEPTAATGPASEKQATTKHHRQQQRIYCSSRQPSEKQAATKHHRR